MQSGNHSAGSCLRHEIRRASAYVSGGFSGSNLTRQVQPSCTATSS